MIPAFIFARGGSKSIPNKNLVEVAGKSLLQRAIEVAKDLDFVDEIIVSSDSDRIGRAALEYGALYLNRPASLAADETPEIFAWKHALSVYDPPFFLSVPTTTPLKSSEDVSKVVQHFQQGQFDLVMGGAESLRSPYLNIFEIDSNSGLAHVVNDIGAHRRQEVPKTYDVSTVAYCASTEYVRSAGSLPEARIGLVPLERFVTLDIDEPYDLELAELLLRNRGG